MLALAVASLVVLPVQTPWYDALIFVLLALMPASGLDCLLVVRCLLLTELVLPGAAPDSGLSGALAGAVAHAGIFVVLAMLVIESWRGSWLPKRVPADGRPLRSQPVQVAGERRDLTDVGRARQPGGPAF